MFLSWSSLDLQCTWVWILQLQNDFYFFFCRGVSVFLPFCRVSIRLWTCILHQACWL